MKEEEELIASWKEEDMMEVGSGSLPEKSGFLRDLWKLFFHEFFEKIKKFNFSTFLESSKFSVS